MSDNDKFNIIERNQQKSLINLIRSNIKNVECVNTTSQNHICYAAAPNSLSIRSDGKINKCTVALNNEFNTIGRIKSDGIVEIDNMKLKPWMRGFENMDYNILGCPLKGM
jgi:uncharacterized protein